LDERITFTATAVVDGEVSEVKPIAATQRTTFVPFADEQTISVAYLAGDGVKTASYSPTGDALVDAGPILGGASARAFVVNLFAASAVAPLDYVVVYQVELASGREFRVARIRLTPI